jgi:putative transposase
MEEIKAELIDELLKGYQKPEDLIGENGLLKQLTKAVLERALNTELTHHLGYEKHDPAGHHSGNSRNGTSAKTIKGNFGELVLETPRDRNGRFEPQIVGKHQTRFDGFDDKILSLYARGMSTREIQGHLKDIYGVEVSPTPNFGRDRCGARGSERVAEPAVGAALCDRLPGRLVREDAT